MTVENIGTAEARRLAERSASIDARARHIINDAMLNIIWAGAVPLPVLDGLFVAYVQAHMVDQICSAHGVKARPHLARTLMAAGAGGALASLVGVAARGLKLVPGLGQFAAAPFVIVTAAITTYATGTMFHQHLKDGGQPDTFDPTANRKAMRQAFGGSVLALKRSQHKGRQTWGL